MSPSPAEASSEKPPRKPNPKCAGCNHPRSFHPRDAVKHRRPCNAFGCHCKNFKKGEE